MNIYYSPEKFGLEQVGEVNWSDGYDFDKHVLWFRRADERYLWAHDSGCSCPSPFESHGIDDLNVLPDHMEGVTEFQAVLTEHDKGQYRYSWNGPWTSLNGDAVALLERYAARVMAC